MNVHFEICSDGVSIAKVAKTFSLLNTVTATQRIPAFLSLSEK